MSGTYRSGGILRKERCREEFELCVGLQPDVTGDPGLLERNLPPRAPSRPLNVNLACHGASVAGKPCPKLAVRDR